MIPAQERGDLESIVLVGVSKLEDTQIPRNDATAPMIVPIMLTSGAEVTRHNGGIHDCRSDTRGTRNGVGQCPRSGNDLEKRCGATVR
jgi:hypothetical protein